MIGYDGFKHRDGAKVHVAVDEGSKPIALALSHGSTYDSKVFNESYDKINRKRLHTDLAYDADEVRLKADGVEANIPEEWEGTVRCGKL